ncbi:MAG: hypothetical protein FJZ43_02165 [Candidatus Staskawiczbacteria bacterium]|nr:hypothetical protein [Candidatus Staskawiczbacteria bacterium]
MEKEIVLLAKYLKEFGGSVYSFDWFEEKFKIKNDVCLHVLNILKEAGAIDFGIMPWHHNGEPDKMDEFLNENIDLVTKEPIKELKIITRETKEGNFKEKTVKYASLHDFGVVILNTDIKLLSKIIASPSSLDAVFKKIGLYPQKPVFNEKEGKIFLLDKSCSIPAGNQFELCKTVFGRPIGEWIAENDLANAIDITGSKKGNRYIYDTMLAVNEKVKEKLGVEDLMEWDLSKLRIRKELFG